MDTDSTFVCECREDVRTACVGEPFYGEHEGKRYCVLHFPRTEKIEDSREALQRKLDNNDFNFRGVWFPEDQSFLKHHFVKADFSHATFNAEASFRFTTFNDGVDFKYATFNATALFGQAFFYIKADFSETTFNASVYFYRATFNTEAIFSSATFKGAANFPSTFFIEGADFHSASFSDRVEFSGSDDTQEDVNIPSLDFRFTKIEKPDQVSFRGLTLRPRWFVAVDARKFEFFAVNWDLIDINQEIASIKRRDGFQAHRYLSEACRNLAINAEENHRYGVPQASGTGQWMYNGGKN